MHTFKKKLSVKTSSQVTRRMAQPATRQECECGAIVGANFVIEQVGLDHRQNQVKGDKLILKSCGLHDDGKHRLRSIQSGKYIAKMRSIMSII